MVASPSIAAMKEPCVMAGGTVSHWCEPMDLNKILVPCYVFLPCDYQTQCIALQKCGFIL